MHTSLWLPRAWLLLATLFLTVTGCAEMSQPPPALSPVAITDIGSVAGKWAGPVTGLTTRRDEGDWVNVVIGRDGTYDFGIYRTIGVFGGKGKLTLQDGKLALQGDRGSSTLTLFEGGGKRVLRGDGVLSDGTRINSELTPVR
jgi:hypothetical protein